jgi:alkylhydroperoxidase/carboxymuconolactone decarboxylase family protein YurZ
MKITLFGAGGGEVQGKVLDKVTRRQFVAATGQLLGAVAVAELAMAKAQAAEMGKGSDEKTPAPHQAGTKLPTNRGPWDPAALEKLREWDPRWAKTCVQMTTNPWTSGVLPLKTVELVSIAWNAACTNLNADGTRRHIRAALDAGATRDEILVVLQMASFLSIHTCSLGAPILLEEAKAGGVKPRPKEAGATPACDRMKAAGQWNTAWDPFFELSPDWTEQFMATAGGIYLGGVLSPKDAELLSIAFDASITHMYAPGTRRHIKAALKVGATMEEIFEVLKICVVLGVQACNLSVPILAEEIAKRSAKDKQPKKKASP